MAERNPDFRFYDCDGRLVRSIGDVRLNPTSARELIRGRWFDVTDFSIFESAMELDGAAALAFAREDDPAFDAAILRA